MGPTGLLVKIRIERGEEVRQYPVGSDGPSDSGGPVDLTEVIAPQPLLRSRVDLCPGIMAFDLQGPDLGCVLDQPTIPKMTRHKFPLQRWGDRSFCEEVAVHEYLEIDLSGQQLFDLEDLASLDPKSLQSQVLHSHRSARGLYMPYQNQNDFKEFEIGG